MKKHPFIRWAALLMLSCAGMQVQAQAQSYPEKPVRIVVPFSAGGLTDVLARGVPSN